MCMFCCCGTSFSNAKKQDRLSYIVAKKFDKEVSDPMMLLPMANEGLGDDKQRKL